MKQKNACEYEHLQFRFENHIFLSDYSIGKLEMSPTSGPKINDTGFFSINPLICFSPMESRLITSSQSHFDKAFPFTDSNTSTLRKQHLKSRIIQRYHHFGNISKPKVSYNVPINLDMSQNCKTPELPATKQKKNQFPKNMLTRLQRALLFKKKKRPYC